jgi:hypothetical protein
MQDLTTWQKQSVPDVAADKIVISPIKLFIYIEGITLVKNSIKVNPPIGVIACSPFTRFCRVKGV